ncbi:MAG: aminotransferase class I/II-fold pyridoxal phosphate-dependent enzyme [Pseudomonadota bacterium]
MKSNRAPETLVAQARHFIEPESGAIIPPIQPSSTFARDEDYELKQGYLYSRYTSPPMDHAEELIAELEGGAASMLFGSGLAAIAAVIETVPNGGHIILPRIMYFGAQAWFQRCAEKRGLKLDLVDQTDPEAIAAAIRPGTTDLVWIETPANPTWDIVDIEQTAAIAHEAGAILGVDGTAAPPCTTRALAHGADITMAIQIFRR